jgi:hypothetical protein
MHGLLKPTADAVNADVQKRRFALLLHAGYGERCATMLHVIRL